MTPKKFHTQHRSKFNELDPFNHMNTQHYLGHFLDHRFIAIRENLGLGLKEISQLPFIFVISNLNIGFQRPIIGDEAFSIESWIAKTADRTCEVLLEMKKLSGSIAATCSMELTCVDKVTGRPTTWPPEFISQFFER